MRIRRLAATASTLLVAIVVALVVPFSQLRTFSIETSCCCPDPSHCHCPDHDTSKGTQPCMRACHKTSHEVVSPDAPAFAAPELAIAEAPVRAVGRATWTLAEPHSPPVLPRPDAPS